MKLNENVTYVPVIHHPDGAPSGYERYQPRSLRSGKRAKTNGSSGRSTQRRADRCGQAAVLGARVRGNQPAPRSSRPAMPARAASTTTFPGKIDLAQAALQSIAQEEIARLDDALRGGREPAGAGAGVHRGAAEAVRGCRLGRFAYEMSIEQPQINDPVAGYFRSCRAGSRRRWRGPAAGADRARRSIPSARRSCWSRSCRARSSWPACTATRQVFNDALRGARALIERCVTARSARPRASARPAPARARRFHLEG